MYINTGIIQGTHIYIARKRHLYATKKARNRTPNMYTTCCWGASESQVSRSTESSEPTPPGYAIYARCRPLKLVSYLLVSYLHPFDERKIAQHSRQQFIVVVADFKLAAHVQAGLPSAAARCGCRCHRHHYRPPKHLLPGSRRGSSLGGGVIWLSSMMCWVLKSLGRC